MDLKQFLTEDRGVSPVIGVILMVAITVILAAVIGAFVLGLGDQVSNNAPQASFEFDFEDKTNVTITHGGGDDIDNTTLEVTLDGTDIYPVPDNSVNNITIDSGWNKSTIRTGDSVDVFSSNDSYPEIAEGGETIRIVWNNPSGGSSNTLGERDWPN